MPRSARLPYVQRFTLADGTPRFRGYADIGEPPLKKRIFSRSFDNALDAHHAAMRMRRLHEQHVDAQDLDRAVAVLLEDVETKRTKGSVVWYRQHLDAVRRVIPGRTLLCQITRDTIERFIRTRQKDWVKEPVVDKETGKVVDPGRKVKAATIHADLRALHRVFAVARKANPHLVNPVSDVDRPRVAEVAMDWFGEAEIRELLGRVEYEPDRDLFTLFVLTGLRRSEVARLRVESVRFTTMEVIVAGKNRTRTVPIRPALEGPLRRLLARAEVSACPEKRLVPGRVLKDPERAKTKDRETASLLKINATFKLWRDRLGDRRLHPHALRHTFGTALVRKGVPLDVVMRLMGHSKITTTQKYLHVAGVHSEEALDRLDVLPPAPPCPPPTAAALPAS